LLSPPIDLCPDDDTQHHAYRSHPGGLSGCYAESGANASAYRQTNPGKIGTFPLTVLRILLSHLYTSL
jgi:hypothetical protein